MHCVWVGIYEKEIEKFVSRKIVGNSELNLQFRWSVIVDRTKKRDFKEIKKVLMIVNNQRIDDKFTLKSLYSWYK